MANWLTDFIEVNQVLQERQSFLKKYHTWLTDMANEQKTFLEQHNNLNEKILASLTKTAQITWNKVKKTFKETGNIKDMSNLIDNLIKNGWLIIGLNEPFGIVYLIKASELIKTSYNNDSIDQVLITQVQVYSGIVETKNFSNDYLLYMLRFLYEKEGTFKFLDLSVFKDKKIQKALKFVKEKSKWVESYLKTYELVNIKSFKGLQNEENEEENEDESNDNLNDIYYLTFVKHETSSSKTDYLKIVHLAINLLEDSKDEYESSMIQIFEKDIAEKIVEYFEAIVPTFVAKKEYKDLLEETRKGKH